MTIDMTLESAAGILGMGTSPRDRRRTGAESRIYRLGDDFTEEDECGWAIGSELEFVDEPADDWDGPVGDGLDEEEGIGGMAIQNPRAPTPDTSSSDTGSST